MPKPWYTLTVMICSDKEQIGVGIRVQGPATRRGRFGPIVAELEETLDGTHSAPARAALLALKLALEKG
jgi:hypothetical protein